MVKDIDTFVVPEDVETKIATNPKKERRGCVCSVGHVPGVNRHVSGLTTLM
jgi:hypothetical protein